MGNELNKLHSSGDSFIYSVVMSDVFHLFEEVLIFLSEHGNQFITIVNFFFF